MIQHQKKDYLIRLIEELFKKLYQILHKESYIPEQEKQDIINDIYTFYSSTFDVNKDDQAETIIDKIKEIELLEQYARILFTDYSILSNRNENNLYIALDIINFIDKRDSTYSWERTILREDILRILDHNKENDSHTV